MRCKHHFSYQNNTDPARISNGLIWCHHQIWELTKNPNGRKYERATEYNVFQATHRGKRNKPKVAEHNRVNLSSKTSLFQQKGSNSRERHPQLFRPHLQTDRCAGRLQVTYHLLLPWPSQRTNKVAVLWESGDFPLLILESTQVCSEEGTSPECLPREHGCHFLLSLDYSNFQP